MLIRVMYRDNRFDYVKTAVLDELLSDGALAGFRRKAGWVLVGRDPVRGGGSFAYGGPERRIDGRSPAPIAVRKFTGASLN